MAGLSIRDLRGESANIIKYPVLVLGVGAERGIQDVVELGPPRGGPVDRIIGVGPIEAASCRERFILIVLRQISGVLGFAGVMDAHNFLYEIRLG